MRTIEQIRSQHNHHKCNCPRAYAHCRMWVIFWAERGMLDGTKFGTAGGKGHGGWTGYGAQAV